MLVKNPDERPTAQEVKEHPWLKQFTITKLSFTPKTIDVHKADATDTPQISTGYQVISKPETPTKTASIASSVATSTLRPSSLSKTSKQGSKVGEEDMQYSDSSNDSQSDIFEELTTKENLDRLKTQISSQHEEQYSYKTNISVKELEINNRLARLKDLQTAIEEKTAYKNYLMRNVDKFNCQIAEKNVESEKLQLIAAPDQLIELISKNKLELAEKTAKFSIESSNLQQLKSQISIFTSEITQKERQMNDLSAKLQKLHLDFKSSRVSLSSNLSELRLNSAFIQSRLKSDSRKSILQGEDQIRAEELMEYIKAKSREYEEGENRFKAMKKKVETLENEVFAKEEEINAMVTMYERKKLDVRQGLQVKIREIKQNQREKQAKMDAERRRKVEKQREELRNALQTVRDQSFKTFYTLDDYAKIKEMHLELKMRWEQLRHSLDFVSKQRSELAVRMKQLADQELALKGRRRK